MVAQPVPRSIAPVESAPEREPIQVARTGTGYQAIVHANFADDGGEGYWFRIDYERLKWDDSYLNGQVAVRTNIPTVQTFADGYVLTDRTNLISDRSKNGLADSIKKQAPDLSTIDWRKTIAEISHRIVVLEREGEPLVSVADIPARVATPLHLDPVLMSRMPHIMYGQGGIGKSNLAIAMAVSVATGKPIIPGWQPRQSPVLYLDFEMDQDDFAERVDSICMGAGITRPRQLYYRYGVSSLADSQEEIERRIREVGAGMVCVDPMESAMANDTGRTEKNARTIAFYRALRFFNVTGLIVDHISAENATTNVAAKPYGDIFKRERARASYEYRRLREDPDGTIHAALVNWKRNNGRRLMPIGISQTFVGGAVSFGVEEARLDEEEPITGQELLQNVLHSTLLAAGALTIEELAARTGKNEGSVKTYLYRFAKGKGTTELFNRLPSGRWEALPVYRAVAGGAE